MRVYANINIPKVCKSIEYINKLQTLLRHQSTYVASLETELARAISQAQSQAMPQLATSASTIDVNPNMFGEAPAALEQQPVKGRGRSATRKTVERPKAGATSRSKGASTSRKKLPGATELAAPIATLLPRDSFSTDLAEKLRIVAEGEAAKQSVDVEMEDA